jgi:hypothetical protein
VAGSVPVGFPLGLQMQVEAVRHVVRAHVVVRVNSFGGVPDAQGRGVQHEPGDMLTSGFTTQLAPLQAASPPGIWTGRWPAMSCTRRRPVLHRDGSFDLGAFTSAWQTQQRTHPKRVRVREAAALAARPSGQRPTPQSTGWGPCRESLPCKACATSAAAEPGPVQPGSGVIPFGAFPPSCLKARQRRQHAQPEQTQCGRDSLLCAL